MMSNRVKQKPVEAFYMNALPFSARKVGLLLLREYRLDQLVNMRIAQVDKDLDARFKLAPEIWELTLNYVILTKLSSFSIHSQLTAAHLVGLHKVAALSLNEPKANTSQLIEKVQEQAPVLADWLKQLKTALARKKS